MIGAHIRDLAPADLRANAETLRASGGRLQFAYAWTNAGGIPELRYLVGLPAAHAFDLWACPSAATFPASRRSCR